MRCPFCVKIGQESMTFPANNLEKSPEIPPFYDEEGRKIIIRPTALSYGCVYGHVFKLAESKVITEINGAENMPDVQEAVRLPRQFGMLVQ